MCNKERTIKLIKKLYALGTSPNREEAESAVTKAHELMLKYNIAQKDISLTEKSYVWKKLFEGKKYMPGYIKEMVTVLAKHFVLTSAMTRHKGVSSTGRNYIYSYSLNVYGDPVNIELFDYTVDFVLLQCTTLADDFVKTKEAKVAMMMQGGHKGYGRQKIRDHFCRGIVTSIYRKLQAQKESFEEKGLIVVAPDPGCLGKTKSKGKQINPLAYGAGTEAGEGVIIRAGIKTDKTGSSGLQLN